MYFLVSILAYILGTTLFVWTMAHYGFDSQHTMKFFYIALSVGIFSIIVLIFDDVNIRYEINITFKKYCPLKYVCNFILFILIIFAFPFFIILGPTSFFLGKLGKLDISLEFKSFIYFCVTFTLSFIFFIMINTFAR